MMDHRHPTQFAIIGLDDSSAPYLLPSIQALIHEDEVFSGGLRHHDIISTFLPEGAEWIDITVPLGAVFARYETYDHIVVFASSDPFFFGFTSTVRRRLPEAGIQPYPTFNSLQTLVHRLVAPHDDMRTVSLTGCPWHGFDRALIERTSKIGILTGREHILAVMARHMLDYGYAHYMIYIGEHLDSPERERIRQLGLQKAAELTFEYPNYLTVHQYPGTYTPAHPGARVNLPPLGIPDEEFGLLDRRIRMITKAPTRLLTLSALELNHRVPFWDIDFCIDSVSIKAKLRFLRLHVTSFETRPEGQRLMGVNSRRSGTPGITVLISDFLEVDLDTIFRPDAAFIGRHGGHLKEMVTCISYYLLPGGCIVFNSVSEESKSLFIEGVREARLRLLSGTRITISEYNPIEILKAKRQ